MRILENIPLSKYTTLRIGGPARYFVEVTDEHELSEGLTFAKVKPSETPVFILGGGSNILFADKGFDGLIIRPMIMGREIVRETDDHVLVRVGAGEVLDNVIDWAVKNNWWGMENLSFIPGLTGALAIQNVGAYGQEASEVIESVEVFDIANGKSQMLSWEECEFAYRHSRFNTRDKNKFVILRATLRLKKSGTPNLQYKDLQDYFGIAPASPPPLTIRGGSGEINQADVRKAVIEIRTKKGQDTSEVWSAGSFFKNFVVSDNDGNEYKISAAEILDKRLGLKGFRVGGAKLSEKQVINVINAGGASAKDCIELFEQVREIVREKTGLILVNEPEFVGF